MDDILSHLLQMRGLKQMNAKAPCNCSSSHLLQMRGLKLTLVSTNRAKKTSHLLQMRGLKLILLELKYSSISRIFYRCVD